MRKVLSVLLAALLVAGVSLVPAAPASSEHTSEATVVFTEGASTVAGKASSLDVTVTNSSGSPNKIVVVAINFNDTGFTDPGYGTPPEGWLGSVDGLVVTYTATTAPIAPGDSQTFVPTVTNPTTAGTAPNPAVFTADDQNVVKSATVTGVLDIDPDVISQLVFITAPETVIVNEVSETFTVQTQDEFGNPSNVEGEPAVIILHSTSATGRFDTDSAGAFDGSINSLTIPVGENSADFYYKDSKGGITPTITASKDPWTPAETGLTVLLNWTVMVYLDADSDLEPYGIENLNQMKAVGSTNEVNIIVLFDGDEKGDSVLYKVLLENLEVLEDEGAVIPETGEVNMGDNTTLTNFIVWTAENYPAANYAIILWDHGAGWRLPNQSELPPLKGVCWDYTDNDHLTIQEVAFGLANTGMTLDLLGFDACLMGMIEVAFEINQTAEVMVGSEAVEPAPGWPYQAILADLVATPIMDNAGLAEVIVTQYGLSLPQNQYTMSAINLKDPFALLVGAVGIAEPNLAGKLISAYPDYEEEIEAVWAETLKFAYGGIDLGDFASKIAANENLPTELREAAGVVGEALAATVLCNYAGGIYEGAQGIAIYMPDKGVYPAIYDDLAFAQFTEWDDFLKERGYVEVYEAWSETHKTYVWVWGPVESVEITTHVGPPTGEEVPEEIALSRVLDVVIYPPGSVEEGIVLMFFTEEDLAEMGITREQMIGISSWDSEWNLYPYSGILPGEWFLSPPSFLFEKAVPEEMQELGWPEKMPGLELKGEIVKLLLKSVPKVKGMLEKNPEWVAVAWAVPWHECPPPKGGVTNEAVTTMAFTGTTLVDYPLPSLYMTWLQQGQNLISLPLHPLNPDIESVLEGMMSPSISEKVEAVWSYQNGEWLGYYPAEPGVGELKEMSDGYGYWLKMTEPTTFTILGSNFRTGAYVPPTYPVTEGWNLIGVKAFLPIYPKHYLNDLVGNYLYLYGYNIFNDEYYTPEILTPFEGYWLYMKGDGQIFGWNDDDLLKNFYPYLWVGPGKEGPWLWWIQKDPINEYLGDQHLLMVIRYLFGYYWTYDMGDITKPAWMNLWSEGFQKYAVEQWGAEPASVSAAGWYDYYDSVCSFTAGSYYWYSALYWYEAPPFIPGWFPFDQPKTVDVVWPGTGITTETVPAWADAFTHLYLPLPCSYLGKERR